MCGRFTNRLTWDEIVRLYRLTMKAPPHNLPSRAPAADPTLIERVEVK